MTESAAHLRIIEETPAYWRVLFDNPPLNIVGASIFEGLHDPEGKLIAKATVICAVLRGDRAKARADIFSVDPVQLCLDRFAAST